MPYYCRSLISQALNHGAQQVAEGLEGARARASRTRPTSPTSRESPALKLIELLRNAGADVSYHDPFVPELSSTGSSSVPLEPERLRLRRDRHRALSIDYDGRRRRGEARRRLPQRDRRNGHVRRQGLEAVTAASASPGSATGARTWRGTSTSSPSCAGSATLDRDRSSAFTTRYPHARATTDFDELLADDELDAVVVATPVADALRAREARARGRQARHGREAAGDARRRGGRARWRLAEEPRPRAHARPPAALPPRRAEAEGAVDAGDARRRPLRVRQPPEPRQDPQGRERAVVARRPRPLGDPVPARRGAVGDVGARQRRSSRPGSRTSSSATCASRRGRSRTCTSRGSTRTRCAS